MVISAFILLSLIPQISFLSEYHISLIVFFISFFCINMSNKIDYHSKWFIEWVDKNRTIITNLKE